MRDPFAHGGRHNPARTLSPAEEYERMRRIALGNAYGPVEVSHAAAWDTDVDYCFEAKRSGDPRVYRALIRRDIVTRNGAADASNGIDPIAIALESFREHAFEVFARSNWK